MQHGDQQHADQNRFQQEHAGEPDRRRPVGRDLPAPRPLAPRAEHRRKRTEDAGEHGDPEHRAAQRDRSGARDRCGGARERRRFPGREVGGEEQPPGHPRRRRERREREHIAHRDRAPRLAAFGDRRPFAQRGDEQAKGAAQQREAARVSEAASGAAEVLIGKRRGTGAECLRPFLARERLQRLGAALDGGAELGAGLRALERSGEQVGIGTDGVVQHPGQRRHRLLARLRRLRRRRGGRCGRRDGRCHARRRGCPPDLHEPLIDERLEPGLDLGDAAELGDELAGGRRTVDHDEQRAQFLREPVGARLQLLAPLHRLRQDRVPVHVRRLRGLGSGAERRRAGRGGREDHAGDRPGFARVRNDLDHGPMQLRDPAHDRQPEARPVGVGAEHAEEPLEDAFAVGLVDADAVVLDLERRLPAGDDAHGRAPADPGVGDRVVEQVVERLAQQERIALDQRRGARRLEAEVDVLRAGARHPVPCRLARERVEVEGDERRRRVGVRAREGEELVDQVRGAVGAGDDLSHRVVDAQRITLPHRDLGLHLEPGERRAHLVRGVGDEAFLRPQARIEPAHEFVEGSDERPHLLRRVVLVERGVVGRLAAADGLGQLAEGLDAAREPEPYEQQRDRHDQELRREDVADDLAREPAPLADGLGHLHEDRSRHAGHLREDVGNAHLEAGDVVVAEIDRLRRELGLELDERDRALAAHDLVPLVADLEEGLVVLVGAQDRRRRGRGVDADPAVVVRELFEIATTLSRRRGRRHCWRSSRQRSSGSPC